MRAELGYGTGPAPELFYRMGFRRHDLLTFCFLQLARDALKKTELQKLFFSALGIAFDAATSPETNYVPTLFHPAGQPLRFLALTHRIQTNIVASLLMCAICA